MQERGLGFGISAASGKTGAFIAAFAMPLVVASSGLRGAMGVLAVVSLVGIVLTLWALPEPARLSLEEAAAEVPVSMDRREELVGTRA